VVLTERGRSNPIYDLALKHQLKTVRNNWDDITFYDRDGRNNDTFPEQFRKTVPRYERMIDGAGEDVISTGYGSCHCSQVIVLIFQKAIFYPNVSILVQEPDINSPVIIDVIATLKRRLNTIIMTGSTRRPLTYVKHILHFACPAPDLWTFLNL
jgi:hypothetical protein